MKSVPNKTHDKRTLGLHPLSHLHLPTAESRWGCRVLAGSDQLATFRLCRYLVLQSSECGGSVGALLASSA